MIARRNLAIPPRMEMDEPARLWMMTHARKNYWRVAAWLSLDDLIQDGFFVWYRLVSGQKKDGPRKKGEPVGSVFAYQWITSRPHMMSLFKRAYENHITNLANGRTNKASFEYTLEDYMDAPTDEIATAYSMAVHAPKEVQAVLELLGTEEGRAKMRLPEPVRRDETRETTNEKFSRLTGISGNVASKVRSYFGDDVAQPRKPEPETKNEYAILRRQGKGPLQALAEIQLSKLAKQISATRGDGLRGSPTPTKTAIDLGRILAEAKNACKKYKLHFTQWIADNLTFSASTVRRYMWIARHAPRLGDLLYETLAEARRFLLAPVGMSLDNSGVKTHAIHDYASLQLRSCTLSTARPGRTQMQTYARA